MHKKFREIIKELANFHIPERGVKVYPDDIFIVSYPRSGNTWTRFLIANLVFQNEEIDFVNIENKVADIYQNRAYKLDKLSRPRILKSHEYFDPRYKKVIYIVRDPRDVAVSYYHYHIKTRWIEVGYPIDDFVGQFVRGELTPQYGSWGENVGSWIGARQNDNNFLLLRYEDMLNQPIDALKKIAVFINIPHNQDVLEDAIAACTVEKMREMEKSQSDRWQTTRKTDPTKQFVRLANEGNWKNEINPQLAGIIEKYWPELLCSLSYLNGDQPNQNENIIATTFG